MTASFFNQLGLSAPLQETLAGKGYTEPSPIQSQAIPEILKGSDLMACAQTGTGKTAAFALPILHALAETNRKPRAGEVRTVILTPTRELAVQVAESFRTYGKGVRFQIGLVHGGVSQHPQVKDLRRGLDVLVATPGRLLDLVEQGHADLSSVATFVLDEADRMLDMGFIADIRRISKELPGERQTLLFSATLAGEVSKLAATLLRNPAEVRIAPEVKTAENIEQRLYFVQQDDKSSLLLDLLQQRRETQPEELNLVFSRTRHGARKLSEKLNRAGIRADAIHGDKTQAARQKTLDRFREGRTPVLVATDVAARGIDVKNITLVVNYDLPMEAEAYVHRIGRTARAGESGRAISFCSRDEMGLLRALERIIRQSVEVEAEHGYHAPDLARKYAAGSGGDRPAKGKGKGGGKRYGSGKRPGGFTHRKAENARESGGGKSFRRFKSPKAGKGLARRGG